MKNHFELWERIVAPLLKEPAVCILPVRRPAQRSESPCVEQSEVAECAIRTVQKGRDRIAVQVVERQNDHSMLVSWSDATRGHFADQRWVSSKSRRGGLCVLTGNVIRKGDPVYRPQRRRKSRTPSGSVMVLAAALERMAGQDAAI